MRISKSKSIDSREHNTDLFNEHRFNLLLTFSSVEWRSSSVELLVVWSAGLRGEARFRVLLFRVKLIVVMLKPSIKSVLVARFDRLRE